MNNLCSSLLVTVLLLAATSGSPGDALSATDERVTSPSSKVEEMTTAARYADLRVLGPLGPEPVIEKTHITLVAADNGRANGVLFAPIGTHPSTVIINFHPNNDRAEHFTMQLLPAAGVAAFGMASRFHKRPGETIQEELALDIAAAIRYMRKEGGFKSVVLLGHSGGGGPTAFYLSQAETPQAQRVSGAPAGGGPDLRTADLPSPDAYILMSPTFGITRKLDPSVVDENDLYAVDPALDLYAAKNGFRMPPEKTTYSEAFLKKFGAAQEARMARLDQLARSYVQEETEYRRWVKSPGFESLPIELQLLVRRRATGGKSLLIHRLAADPKNVDLSLDPSDRSYGLSASQGEYADHPELQNYSAGSSTFVSARAFLSSISSLSKNSNWEQSLPRISLPTLFLYGTADKSIFPGEARGLFEMLGSTQKNLVAIEGAEHTYMPAGPKAGKGTQRNQVVAAIVAWLNGTSVQKLRGGAPAEVPSLRSSGKRRGQSTR